MYIVNKEQNKTYSSRVFVFFLLEKKPDNKQVYTCTFTTVWKRVRLG